MMRRELLVASWLRASSSASHLGALNGLPPLIGFPVGCGRIEGSSTGCCPTFTGFQAATSGRAGNFMAAEHAAGHLDHAAPTSRKVWRWVVAFGAAATGQNGATLAGASCWRWGIGLQNFPEGLAVAMPSGGGLSRGRALWYGQLSGIVEPIAGVLAHALVQVPNRSFLRPGVCGRRDDLRRLRRS